MIYILEDYYDIFLGCTVYRRVLWTGNAERFEEEEQNED